jgi:hypothetical protein
MTQSELLRCLRDVRNYWSTPHISADEINYLESQRLIQRAPTELCAIRLTQQGARFKQGKAVPAETLKETFPQSSNARRLAS